jgi:hypothetical protein
MFDPSQLGRHTFSDCLRTVHQYTTAAAAAGALHVAAHISMVASPHTISTSTHVIG